MRKKGMTCWQFMKCGQEEERACPAVIFDAGKACWTVASTICRGNLTVKHKNCTSCDYYKYLISQKE